MSKYPKLNLHKSNLLSDRIDSYDTDATVLNIVKTLQVEHNAIELYLVRAHESGATYSITTTDVENCIARMANIRCCINQIGLGTQISGGIMNYIEWVCRKLHHTEILCVRDYLS